MSYRILLVQCDSAEATATAHILTEAGHRVAWVDCFADAIRLAPVESADLVVSALRLGAFNGLHVLLRVRANDPDLPVIITGGPNDWIPDIDAFGGRFVATPISPAALNAVVTELLAKRPARDPQGVRTWRRRSTGLAATVRDGTGRVVEMSYGGLRLHLERPPGGASGPFEVKMPSLGVSVQAVARWIRMSDDDSSYWCGAELAHPSVDDARTWRRIVDSLN